VFRLIVRSKRDKDAVEAMVSRFYRGWDVRVESLGGARSPEKMLERLVELGREPGFYIVLLGREDSEAARFLERRLPANFVVHVVPRARVRNARLEQLMAETLAARAKFRLALTWCSWGYCLGWRGETLEDYSVGPGFDLFIGMEGFTRAIERLSGARIGRNPVVLKASNGLHLVYSGRRVKARITIGEGSRFRPEVSVRGDVEPLDNDLKLMLAHNKTMLEALVEASKAFLKTLGDYDTIVVPWSGGKDSTAVLLLAFEVYGRRKVRVVYGNTGVEFPQTESYVEKISSMLGFKPIEAYAGIDRILGNGNPLPTLDNRWCTERKIKAIEDKIAEIADGRTLILVGDRDSESFQRERRPPVRRSVNIDATVAAPLRLWSSLHVELFLLSRSIPLNPLYHKGFYRIGCYMCPALRNWEIEIMITDSTLYLNLVGRPIFRKFIHNRLYRRLGAS